MGTTHRLDNCRLACRRDDEMKQGQPAGTVWSPLGKGRDRNRLSHLVFCLAAGYPSLLAFLRAGFAPSRALPSLVRLWASALDLV